MKRLLTGALLACAAHLAHADTWRVDVLIFAHSDGSGGELGTKPKPLRGEATAIALDERARLEANGIRLLPAERSRLDTHWRRLRNATAFQPLRRLSWLQEDPPERGGPTLVFGDGAPLLPLEGDAVRQLEGTLRLTLRRYLHLDADLRWSERSATDALIRSWPLSEQRRMRSDTLHYLDSARLGLLVEIQRVDEADGQN